MAHRFAGMRYGLAVGLLLSGASAWVSVPFQTGTYYNADGPWQAVTVQVGGFENGTLLSDQWTTVNLIPGGFYNSFIPSPTLCYDADECGTGGIWDPGSNQTQDGAAIDYMPSQNYTNFDLVSTGYVFAQNLNIGGSAAQSYTIPNSTLVSLITGQQTYQNGATTNLEVGTFALGAPAQTQQFTTGLTGTADAYIYAWNTPGYLYNQSTTTSNSFAIHVGSTRFNYAGSLIFGGYDKGRAIGPATSWGETPPNLLDIIIGVETGGSPFTFQNKSNLLVTNTSQHEPILVYPEPIAPYMSLPKQTCDAIVNELPVSFDSVSGYYLWNTSSTLYEKITTSPAYLGFVFPAAAGGTSNVTIKVPFSLLTLNLTETASYKPGITSYFPCVPWDPPAGAPSYAGSEGGSYQLGRAFLQAAYLITSYDAGISWLTQAPGPGASGDGLGVQPQDLNDTAVTIDLYSGGSYFLDSWSGHWTVLASSSGSSPNSTVGGNGGGLSGGDDAGIAVGAVAALVIIAALVIWFVRRRRNRQKKVKEGWHSEPLANGEPYTEDRKDASAPVLLQPLLSQQGRQQQQPNAHGFYAPHGADGMSATFSPGGGDSYEQYSEMSASETQRPVEMPDRLPGELDAADGKARP